MFIGVAWPYANGPFHIGHLAGAYLPGDIFAKYHRLAGDEVLLVSGSDMHGTPILVTAEQEGASPAEIAARYHAVNRDAFVRLGFSFDLFTHTHTIEHERTVQELFLALLEHGFIARRTEAGPYCPKHQRFLPDRYLVGTCPHCGFEQARGDECDRCGRPLEPKELGAPRCALCGTPAEFRPSEHFYLSLDRLQGRLTEFLERQTHWRPGTLKVAQNFLAEGLHPTAITRDLDWGIPLPLDGYPAKRFYVWFDAVIGYLSASKEWAVRAGRPEAWHRYWDPREPARHYYFVGKDNKFHHTIVWPGILLGVGDLHLPYDVPANEWLRVDGEKVSKSRSKQADVFIPSLLEHYAPDVIRFYGALLAPQNHDTELDLDEFEKLRTEVLANQYGNLVQRTLVLARDRYEGRIPDPGASGPAESSSGIADRIGSAHRRITEEYERVHLKEALDLALEEVRDANRRFHEARPWQAPEPERTRIVYENLWRLKAIATWLSPVLPFSSAEVYRMLGFPDPPGPGDWDRVREPPPVGQRLGEVRPLFPREATPSGPPSSSGPGAGSPAAGPVPLAIRSGVVRGVANHPSADKLFVLTVDVGEARPRTVVAGLKGSYAAEDLVGRRVVLLTNLAPRTIRRVTSQGMILAAENGDRAIVLEPPEGVASGTFLEGSSANDREISYDEFASVRLEVGRVIDPVPEGRASVDVGHGRVTVAGPWTRGAIVVVRRDPAETDSGSWLGFGPGAPVRPASEVPVGAKVR